MPAIFKAAPLRTMAGAVTYEFYYNILTDLSDGAGEPEEYVAIARQSRDEWLKQKRDALAFIKAGGCSRTQPPKLRQGQRAYQVAKQKSTFEFEDRRKAAEEAMCRPLKSDKETGGNNVDIPPSYQKHELGVKEERRPADAAAREPVPERDWGDWVERLNTEFSIKAAALAKRAGEIVAVCVFDMRPAGYVQVFRSLLSAYRDKEEEDAAFERAYAPLGHVKRAEFRSAEITLLCGLGQMEKSAKASTLLRRVEHHLLYVWGIEDVELHCADYMALAKGGKIETCREVARQYVIDSIDEVKASRGLAQKLETRAKTPEGSFWLLAYYQKQGYKEIRVEASTSIRPDLDGVPLAKKLAFEDEPEI